MPCKDRYQNGSGPKARLQAQERDQTRFQNKTREVVEPGLSHSSCPLSRSPPSWTRPTTRHGSCNGHSTSRQNRVRTYRCSWNTCSPGRRGCSAGEAGRDPKGTHGDKGQNPQESWRGRPRRKSSWGENPVPSKQEGPGPGS